MTFPDRMINKLTDHIRLQGSALVALSGGIDSMLLSCLTHQSLGQSAHACTVVSEFFITDERRYIDEFVAQYHIIHSYVNVQILGDERIVSNPLRRCYFCKKAIFETLLEKARSEGFAVVLDGTNLDDLNEDRPGIRALHELGVVSPFVQAGVGKREIIQYARSRGLEPFIRPSNTCLATRISPSVRISEEALHMVEKAELYLHGLGFSVVRVRYHEGKVARIEVAPEELQNLLDSFLHDEVVQRFRRIGFRRVSVDMEGYRRQVGSPAGDPNSSLETNLDQYASS